MPELWIDENYKSSLSLRETELAIKFIKDTFEEQLSGELNLQRISSPFFLRRGSGINDDLNGVEKKVSFQVPDADMAQAECLFPWRNGSEWLWPNMDLSRAKAYIRT